MAKIREALKTDLERVEYICKMTADEKSINEELAGKITSAIYSTYYIKEESENCFVLEDNSVVEGYILCAENYKAFSKKFRTIYAEDVKKLDKKSGLFAKLLPIPYIIFGKKYPAHLHINLLPEYQGKGYGTDLINTLIKSLQQKGIKGVMLMASKENTGAIKFYKRNGFKIIISAFGGVVMGKIL